MSDPNPRTSISNSSYGEDRNFMSQSLDTKPKRIDECIPISSFSNHSHIQENIKYSDQY